MSGIAKRDILLHKDVIGGVEYIKPMDWCRVTTSLGTMLEPVTEPFARKTPGQSAINTDYTDEAVMVNGIEMIDLDSWGRYTDYCFSQYIEPRVGR